MRCHLLLLLLPLASAAAGCGLLWPEPNAYEYGDDVAVLSPDTFTFEAAPGSESDVLSAAFARYRGHVFFPPPRTAAGAAATAGAAAHGRRGAITALLVTVLDAAALDLQLGTDESYALIATATDATATLTAQTVFGALRGLETFAQLVVREESTAEYVALCLPLNVTDAPAYPHRGLLIDTARHFLPLMAIQRSIDGLAFSKMNTLHWHIVDAQSFPLDTPSWPRLAAAGAYAPSATYTLADVRRIVAYGRARGVRVVLEIDMPGHAYSWGLGYPGLTVECPLFKHSPNSIPLNPVRDVTFEVVRGVLDDVASAVDDRIIHLGGDEVRYACWYESKDVLEWLAEHGEVEMKHVMQHFQDGVRAHTAALGMGVTLWEEIFHDGVDVDRNTTIFHVWKDTGTLDKVVAEGYRALQSRGWYLDHLQLDWRSFYTNPLSAGPLTEAEEALVLGGEACMWGEKSDVTNHDARVWPRAAVVGERLWTLGSGGDPDAALPRLQTHRCRLVRRGIAAAPLEPSDCPFADV